MTSDRVLVTGASGFIAKHCMAALLRSGYAVRGTVRSLGRQAEIARALTAAGIDDPQFDLIEADLLRDDTWAAAMADCRYVLHIASPFPSSEPRNPDDLIRPAREGAERVIRAAANAGVERFVQTSSVAAIMHSGRPDAEPRTEADWTDTDNSDVATYARSKTLAERAVWQVCEQLQDAGSDMAVVTINPGVVLGPAIDTDLSTSHVLIRMIGGGAYPALPKIAFPVVDVRDVADQHILALTHAAAPNNRWLSCNGTLSLKRIGEIIVETLPDLKRKVPTIEMPSSVVRLVSHFDPNLKSIRADLGKSNLCDNRKSVEQLGMTFRPAEEAVRDAALSLRELKVI